MDSVRDGPEASPGRGDCPPARSAHEGSGDRYRWLVEQSVDVIAELDGDGIIRFANPAVERVLGYRPEDLLGTSGFALIHLDDLPKTREAFADLLQHPGVSGPQFAFRGRHKDGAWRHLEAQGKHVTRDSTQSGIVFCLRDVTAHTQAEAALAARTRQLETVRRVSEEIARELELSTLLGLITRRAKDLIGASMGMIRLWDAAREELVPFAWDGVGEWLVHKALRLGEGVAGTAAQRREGLIVNDFRCSSYATPLHLKRTTYTAVLAEPLLYRAQLVGVLALAREDGAAFTLDQQEVLRLFATQAAIAIQNARLFEAEQQRREQLEAVRVVSAEITRELDLDRLLDLILHRAIDLVGGTAGAILLWDEVNQRLIPQAQCGELAAVTRHPIPPGEGMIGRVAATKTGLRINDYPSWEGARPELQPLGLVAGIAEPLLFHDKLIGVVNIATADKQKRFSEQDNTLLRLLADQAAIAIENARLYQQEQMRRKELEAVRSVSEEITREMDLTALLRLILARAVELAAGDTGVLYLWSEDTQRLIPKNWHGYGEWVADVRLQLEEGVSGTVAARRQGLIVNDFRASPYATPLWLGRSRQVAALSEPLLYHDRLVGVSTISREDPDRPFTAEDQHLLRLFATQAAIAIENARAHERSLHHGEQLEALLRASRTVTAGLDLPTTLEQIAAEASRMARCAQVKVVLLDREIQLLRVGVAHGMPAPSNFPCSIGHGLSGTVAQTGQPLFIADCQSDPRNANQAVDRALGFRTYLGLPVNSGEGILGVLTFNTTEPRTYSAEELTYLTAFADQAAIAIENARLYDAAQRELAERKTTEAALAARTRQLDAIRAVGAEITQELDLQRVLTLIAQQAVTLVGADADSLWVWDAAAQTLRAESWHGHGDWMAGRCLRLGEGFAGTVAQQRTGMLDNAYRTSAHAHPITLAHSTTTASLAEPLLFRDRLLGVLVLDRTAGRPPFQPADQTLLRLFATQAAIAIENAQLHAAAVRRGDELETLLAATRSVMSGLDLQKILDRVVAEAHHISGAPHVKILLLDRPAGLLRVGAARGTAHAPGETMPLDSGTSALVARSGEPLYIAQCAEDPRNHMAARDRTLGMQAYLGLPITRGTEVLGVLTFNTTTPKTFSPADLAYLTAFADQAAIAIENARLFQAEQQRREQLEAVRVVSAEIARELDLDRLLDLILRRAMELAGAEAGVIMLWDEAAQALFPRLRLGEFWAKMPVRPIPLGEGIVGHVAQTRQGLIINDYRAWAGARQLALAHTAITAALGEPLLYRDQLIGAISLVHTVREGVFEAHHGALLRLFADQAAIAIQNAQLHAAAMRRSRELEALVVAMRSVMSGLDLQEILDHILSEAAKMAGTAHVRVALVEREARVLRVARVTGDLVASGFAYPLEGSLSGLVVTKGEPIFSANADSDPQSYFGPRYRELGIVTFLGLPIKSGGEILGVLIFNTSTPRQYSAEELTYLTSFATQAAIALENARLYEAAQRALADLQRTQAELVRAEKLRGLGQMAAGIAHDLNNMLAAILGQVELLKLRGAPPDLQDGLATLETAASDGAQVVRRLQDFARQRAASPLAPLDLGPVVQEALELTRPRWQDELHQRGKTIAIAAALGALPPILGHAPEIREALTNLIFNAVDAMPDGGVLTLAGTATPTAVTLTLTDTGVGMPEAVRQKIFEPFFTTKGVQGTGLGLAVVYSILERHGGRVAVASTPGQGTTVTLHFQAATQEVPAPPPAPGHLPASRRLLLIDDELAVRTTMGTLLRAVGHEVIEASSGADGLASLAEHPVELVITDLGMPGMTGWEVAQQVKAAQPHLPVILLTGWGQQPPPPAAGQECVDRVLGKPIRLDALQAAIAALTGPGDLPHRAA